MSRNKIELPDKLKVKWLMIIIPFVVAVLIGVVSASVKYFATEKTDTEATGRIELNWNGASEGKAPNGEGYDLLRVDNTSIIAEAITRLGLQVTVEEVRYNLVISGQYPKNIINNITNMRDLTSTGSVEKLEVTQFHPSSYVISIKNGFTNEMSKKDLSALLSEIMKGYYNAFYDQYTIGYETQVVDGVLDISRYDYNQILSVISYRLSLIEANAKALSGLDASYRYNKQSFADMAVVAEKVRTTELTKAQADCTVKGLSKDYKSMLQATYYTIRSLQLELKEAEANKESVAKVIKEFERDQSAFVSSALGVELQQGNSDETYQNLMKQQTEYAEKISSLSSKILYYEDIVKNINDSVYSEEYSRYCANFEKTIDELFSKTSQLEKSMSAMVDNYNETVIGDDAIAITDVVVNYPKVLSSGFIVMLIKCCGPFCMLVLIYALVLELRRRILIDRFIGNEEK